MKRYAILAFVGLLVASLAYAGSGITAGPIAHLHAHGVTLGRPWTYDASGVLQRIDSVPTGIYGYVVTSFDFAGRPPDSVLHTHNVAWEVTWER
jgi:hypothetical protein